MSNVEAVSDVLVLDALTAGYGDTIIVRDIHLRVGVSETVAIIGPNGAGKSTVMKAVFGLLNIASGCVRLGGSDITGTPPAQVVAMGVCYVPQSDNVFTSMSVQENLEMGAYIRRDDFRGRIQEIYQMFPDLAAKRNQAAGYLSGGQRQMLAMGKALMLEPKILLLDEPTAGLSPRYRAEIFATIRTINNSGVPILLVEQNAAQALTIAHRAYVLVDGKNSRTGTGAELLEDRAVARMFLGARG